MKTKRSLSVSYCFGCALALGLLATGCGGSSDTGIPEPDDSVAAAAKLNSSSVDFSVLKSSENRIVSNNAEQLEKAFNRNDYTRAAYAIGTIISINLDGEESEAARKAVSQIQEAAKIAAGDGDENAKRALEFLDELFQP